MFKRLWREFGMNPLDRHLRRAVKSSAKRVLICWNRGLGDIALGMYALIYRIRHYLPEAEITFLTRPDLAQGFSLLQHISVLIDPEMKRKQPFNLDASLAKHHLTRADFDLIFEHPDPTYWLKWQLGTLVPRLHWNAEWNETHTRFSLDPHRRYLGVHVQTETSYGYEKNWPLEKWKELFDRIYAAQGVEILLFGHAQTPVFDCPGVIDLRGKTTLAEMLALIKQHCSWLVVPDSGVLSLTYFLDCAFQLKMVSLWADPRQGVLKQNVASPNPHLIHTPLIAPNGELSRVSVDQVIDALFGPPIQQRQRAVLARRHQPAQLSCAPLQCVATSGVLEHGQIGKQLICDGKVGAIMLAGGQGTRLGYPGPKGMVPVSPIHQKSLFQLCAEQVKKASLESGRLLKLGIMTSSLNHQETCQFFKENAYFGLAEDQVDFFEQPLLPFCDDEGNWFTDGNGACCMGPDGNGHVFHAFAASGLWNRWRALGIEYISMIPVDNPLANPFDPELIGFQHQEDADVVLKAVSRRTADEKMGVVASVDGKLRVIEYTELTPEDAAATCADGSLTYCIANAGMFSFRADLIQNIVDRNVEMPLHLARKSTLLNGEQIPVWKFETFIFDLLEYAKHPAVLLYPREQVYSPLKNAQGEKSLETVRAALLESGIS